MSTPITVLHRYKVADYVAGVVPTIRVDCCYDYLRWVLGRGKAYTFKTWDITKEDFVRVFGKHSFIWTGKARNWVWHLRHGRNEFLCFYSKRGLVVELVLDRKKLGNGVNYYDKCPAYMRFRKAINPMLIKKGKTK